VTVLHPLLEELFADLEASGVGWSLLRVPSVPAAPTGDVDLLVAKPDLARLRGVLADHGFVPVPGWERGASRLFVGCHRPSGRCLLLDVTTELAFGPEGAFRVPDAEGALRRSSFGDGMRLLSPDDGFWALLLHCLLDKGAVPVHYRERLRAAAQTATAGVELAHALGAAAERLRTAVARAEWPEVEQAAGPTAQAWRQRLSAQDRLRTTARKASAVLRRPALLRRRYGVSLALLGPNGAGKSTLAAGIVDAWPFPVRQVYMGLWKSGGTAGSEIPVVSQLLRVPTAWLRYATGLSAQLRGHLVVYDRYVHDARLPPDPPFRRLKSAYLFLLAHSVPAPDLLVLLAVPGTVSHGRKAENSVAEAQQEHEGYLAIARELPQVQVVDATASPDEVRAQVMALIWDRCLRRWGRAAPGAAAAGRMAPS
jgi:thymidylate kinase